MSHSVTESRKEGSINVSDSYEARVRGASRVKIFIDMAKDYDTVLDHFMDTLTSNVCVCGHKSWSITEQ